MVSEFTKCHDKYIEFITEISVDLTLSWSTDECFHFNKFHTCGFEKVTGWKITISDNNIVVIDFDINKELDKILSNDKIEKVINDLECELRNIAKKTNSIVVKTASNSYHLYCNGRSIRDEYDYYNMKNVYIKMYEHFITVDDLRVSLFDIDLFIPTKNTKGSSTGVMLPGSRVKNKKGEIGSYEVIEHKVDSSKKLGDIFTVWMDLQQYCALNKIQDYMKEIEPDEVDLSPISKKTIAANSNLMTKKLFDLIKNGFDGLTIHNFASNIEKEISLYPLVTALNACVNKEITNDDVSEFIDYIHKNAKLTPNAEKNFHSTMTLSDVGGTPFSLVKMLKCHNPDYYEKKIKKIYGLTISKSKEREEIYKLADELYNLSKITADDADIIIRSLYSIKDKVLDEDEIRAILDNVECVGNYECDVAISDMIDASLSKGLLNIDSLRKLAKSELLDKNIVNEIIDGFSNVDLDEKEAKSILSDIKSLEICKNDEVYKGLVCDLMLKSNVDARIIKSIYNEVDIYEKSTYSNVLGILKHKNKEVYDNITKKLNIKTEYKTGIDLNDDFAITDIGENYYISNGIIDFDKLFSDISRTIVAIKNTKFIYKKECADNSEYKLTRTSDEDIKQISKRVAIQDRDGAETNISLYDILFGRKYITTNNKFINLYSKRNVSFYSTDPKTFSIFRGFGYKNIDDVNMESISSFLDYVENIIAAGNKELYTYILKWVSYIIQNPGKRTNSCLVLLGEQGTGKTTFVNTICKLFGNYAKTNSQRLDDIVGSFNGTIEGKMIIVMNELSAVDHFNKKAIHNQLKTLITDDTLTINRKGLDQYTIENVSNFIICSNDFNPIMIENGDRRYVVIEVSDKVAKDRKYFGNLKNGMDENFYTNLYNYFRLYNCEGFMSLDIPDTKIKGFIIENSQDSFDYYLRENIKDYYPVGKFSSKARAFSSYIEFCYGERLKITYDGMKFKSLLEKKCYLKSVYVSEIKDSRKFYTLMEKYVKDYVNNDQ